MDFEVLKYEKAGNVDSLKSTWLTVSINLKQKEDKIKQDVQEILVSNNLGKFSLDKITMELEIGIIEVLDENDKEIIQFRSND